MKKKSAAETIEKDIEIAGKSIKRNWKRIVLVAAVSIIVVSFLLFITGLRIRFAVQDDLIINLNPPEASFTIANDQYQDVTFEVSAYNSIFCVADCSYSLYDRSEEKVLDKGAASLKNRGYFNKTYRLMPYTSGSGQKIYNFDIQCSNIRSFFCKTQSPVRQRSSFITLNYKLTEEEEKIKSELEPAITQSFILINNASGNLQRSFYILNATSGKLIESDSLYGGYSSMLESLDDSLEQTKSIADLWSQEDYTRLDSLYGESLTNQSYQLYKESSVALSRILDSIGKQNNLSSYYNQLKNNLFEKTKLEENYIRNSPLNGSIIQNFYTAYNYFQLISLNASKKGYSLLSDFEKDLINISGLTMEFNAMLDNNHESITLKGKNLSSMEYSKKCYLGYCENLTGDACLDLEMIFLEYSVTAYTIPADISISNISYYTEADGAIKILASNESKEYYNSYCLNYTGNTSLLPTDIPDIKKLELIDIYGIPTIEPIKNELTENPPMCCIYGECSPCCTTEECRNDPALFPVILIHGHSLLRKTSPEPALDSFNKVQYQLQEDGYVNAGIIRFDFNASGYKENEWGLFSSPISAKASYYYDYFYSLGRYIYITKNADNLDSYAIRLKDIVELVKHRTGKPKVNIIAHSMGGLVARRYIQIFGEDSVDKLILIATPNKGIDGNAKKLCHVFGEKRECEDMYADSVLIQKLNDPNYKPKKARFYTISGKGCKTGEKDGDGVVTFESSVLSYATSYVVDGRCDDALKRGLHSSLPNIDRYPKVYEYVKKILEMP